MRLWTYIGCVANICSPAPALTLPPLAIVLLLFTFTRSIPRSPTTRPWDNKTCQSKTKHDCAGVVYASTIHHRLHPVRKVNANTSTFTTVVQELLHHRGRYKRIYTRSSRDIGIFLLVHTRRLHLGRERTQGEQRLLLLSLALLPLASVAVLLRRLRHS